MSTLHFTLLHTCVTPHLEEVPSNVSRNLQAWQGEAQVCLLNVIKVNYHWDFLFWMQIIEMIEMEMKTCAFDD